VSGIVQLFTEQKKDKREAEREGKEYMFLLKKGLLKKGGMKSVRVSRLCCAHPKL
jgi:hypothetical protein